MLIQVHVEGLNVKEFYLLLYSMALLKPFKLSHLDVLNTKLTFLSSQRTLYPPSCLPKEPCTHLPVFQNNPVLTFLSSQITLYSPSCLPKEPCTHLPVFPKNHVLIFLSSQRTLYSSSCLPKEPCTHLPVFPKNPVP